MAAPGSSAGLLAQALIDFSLHGALPEKKVSLLVVQSSDLPLTITALADAKALLESEIETINAETADDVEAWQLNAQLVQDDVERSKALANDIMRTAEVRDVSGRVIADVETKAELLISELNYNGQVLQALREIKVANEKLDQVERARSERRVLDALRLLDESWSALGTIPVSKSVRALKLLEIRASELRESVHELFNHVWEALICLDVDGGKVTLYGAREDEPMSLEDAVTGLKAFKELDRRAAQLWYDLDLAIFASRMDMTSDEAPPAIQIEDNVLIRTGTADKNVCALVADMKQILSFLVEHLPRDLIDTMSLVMVPEMVSRITAWLDSAVPLSLTNMDGFERAMDEARKFQSTLEALGLSAFGDLGAWVEDAPKVWLEKRRASALDSVRVHLSKGLGASKVVERIERQTSRSEGKELAAKGVVASSDDHGSDTAWLDDKSDRNEVETAQTAGPSIGDGGDDGADAWGWGDDYASAEKVSDAAAPETQAGENEEDHTEAWGWGDDGHENETDVPEPQPQASKPAPAPAPEQKREITPSETCKISSLPESVLALIIAVLEDGAALTNESHRGSPVATAAAGLFSVPTLVLAMYRAVSPYYYALVLGGAMYLYNDATYLAEWLSDFAASWKQRLDLCKRAQTPLGLADDINLLGGFAARAYSNEMSTQKTVLHDLLGATQNLMQQGEKDSSVQAAVERVRSVAATWEGILARSAWFQAVGSLVDAVAVKLIEDVMDMPSIGQDDAYAIAVLIAAVTELDDLFLTDGDEDAEAVPATAQYAPSWLRLKFLSEVLQSNLIDVRFLWMESELSLYFSAEELVDLIILSFEDNQRTREAIREIKHNPHPVRREEDKFE